MEFLLRVTGAGCNQMTDLIFVSDFSQWLHAMAGSRNDENFLTASQ